jgi:hypothetical protein
MKDALDPVAVVRSMWEAWADGRIGDALATMDTDVTWTPLTRPALNRYCGHEGVRQLRVDSTRIHGSYRTEVHLFTLQDDGSVTARGLLIIQNVGADPYLKLEFEAVCVLVDGLIVSIDSYEPASRLA